MNIFQRENDKYHCSGYIDVDNGCLRTKCISENCEMLVTDFIHLKNRQLNDSVTNILNMSPS